MKADEAPEKLYVDVNDNLSDSILYGFTEKQTDDDIEYTRTDAFVKRACEWLEPVLKNYAGYNVGKDILRDFKNYMMEEKV